ncbi:aminotransferase class V-fold PLP-dependent enzyme [Microcella daejeonensis]|uniref:Aminotransferase class V-fold PLP-dependent enzyme n=1 Tax=Microcella daejeonensis TaxID=2994971 RepID=A0A9E8S7W3_9MICO|nr:aminotransferase class V-fold PLP-dependent enzyme [Microcella daejeonensis]WAB80573.1 aminotransferase class V-fold PLP-dependent enzyme [Microcella daejeonensis]
MISIDEYASRFREDPGYLNFASAGPVGETVIAEMRAQSEILARARFGSLPDVLGEEERVDAAVAALLGRRPDQVVFQPSTSQALMHVMFGLTGGVALSPGEFPSVGYAAARAAEALGVLVPHAITPEHERITPAVVRDQMASSVVAVCVSLVDYRTGHLVDLEGIRQVIGDRLLIVDAIQGVGVVEAPWELADVIVSGGQKWLRAGYGTGFLALSDRAREQLTPVWSGWMAIGDLPDGPEHEILPPQADARAFRVGFPDPAAQGRLAVAVEEVLDVGVGVLRERVLERASRVIDLLDEVGLPVVSPREDAERAGIVVAEPAPEQLSILTAALHNHGVTVTARGGLVRFAPHATTSDETLELLRASLAEYQAGSRV